ncbi:MAG: FAD-binding protein [Bacteroidales bacterium]|nr:FAD-binding protein [Bacteroidales bacterium]
MVNRQEVLSGLKRNMQGDVLTDFTSLTIYANDASAYQEEPLAVIIARNNEDIRQAIKYACENKLSVIPRTAGTSLAGQVVGNGIVVDCSKHFGKILEINSGEKWVRIEPGVVLDELNMKLKPYGLYFGPETSTSNRCMIGGMVGNNSCGAHSIIYGSTRDHTLEIKGYLSDGSEVHFKNLTKDEFNKKLELKDLEGEIYRNINKILSDSENQKRIREEFPDPRLKRRNTGYAIDILLETEPFNNNGEPFNFCKLICGSEGTLMFATEIKLNLVDLPPKENGLLVVHLNSVDEALKANLVALKHKPVAVELIDNYILECTKTNIEQNKNRFFLKGDPGALLCIEFVADKRTEIDNICKNLITDLKSTDYGYEYPVLYGGDISKVWALRKAGLGLLSNIPGDAKPQPVIEDTAVSPEYLPEYIDDFNEVLEELELSCVFYAHIATGELHLRPMINLKTEEGVQKFREVALRIAKIVKKYRGSLSGEHGDGRLRGEFIPLMIGQENYELLKDIKKIWDPNGVFNVGKITDTPPMDSSLRYKPGQATPQFDTILDFSDNLGLIRLAEKCNGSADCRKSAIIGGTMCPSYQATRDEDKTTRARANMLRNILTNSKGKNPFNNKELFNVLDLCLSCKGCKSECPSNVDMAKLKTEFLYQYYKSNRVPLRTTLIAYYSSLQSMASKVAGLYNVLVKNKFFSSIIKKSIGFALGRSLPKVYAETFKKWLKRNLNQYNNNLPENAKKVFLFIDEFTNFNDVPIGKTTVKLLSKLGYRVFILKNKDSGRPFISKGFLKKVRKLAKYNVELFSGEVTSDRPLIGIEPSAILTFRDEYPDLLRDDKKEKALQLAENTFTMEEFLVREIENKNISADLFTKNKVNIKFHGHCQQKAISTTQFTKTILSIPENYSVEEIKSGCCGMAGSFGYEKEHFDLSMKVGELVLFPAVKKAEADTIIVAAGTSCRHQIKDGTSVIAKHPVEVLYEALI